MAGVKYYTKSYAKSRVDIKEDLSVNEVIDIIMKHLVFLKSDLGRWQTSQVGYKEDDIRAFLPRSSSEIKKYRSADALQLFKEAIENQKQFVSDFFL